MKSSGANEGSHEAGVVVKNVIVDDSLTEDIVQDDDDEAKQVDGSLLGMQSHRSSMQALPTNKIKNLHLQSQQVSIVQDPLILLSQAENDSVQTALTARNTAGTQLETCTLSNQQNVRLNTMESKSKTHQHSFSGVTKNTSATKKEDIAAMVNKLE